MRPALRTSPTWTIMSPGSWSNGSEPLGLLRIVAGPWRPGRSGDGLEDLGGYWTDRTRSKNRVRLHSLSKVPTGRLQVRLSISKQRNTCEGWCSTGSELPRENPKTWHDWHISWEYQPPRGMALCYQTDSITWVLYLKANTGKIAMRVSRCMFIPGLQVSIGCSEALQRDVTRPWPGRRTPSPVVARRWSRSNFSAWSMVLESRGVAVSPGALGMFLCYCTLFELCYIVIYIVYSN